MSWWNISRVCLSAQAAHASPAQVGVEIETVQLGGSGIEPFDADRADNQGAFADDEELALRRLVVMVEVHEIGNFR